MQALETTGVPLGLIPWATFASEEKRLAPGDMVVIYSDGVTEAHGASGDFYGTERLREVIRANAHLKCVALHDAILNDVRAFTQGVPQADDVTLVVFGFQAE